MPRWRLSCALCPGRRSSASAPSPKQWAWRGWCAAWKSSVTRSSTCARRPTRRWSSRSAPSEPCVRTSIRGWRPCRSGSVSWSARSPARPPSPARAHRRRLPQRWSPLPWRPPLSQRRSVRSPARRRKWRGDRPSVPCGAARKPRPPPSAGCCACASASAGAGAPARRQGARGHHRGDCVSRDGVRGGDTDARSRRPHRGLGRRHPAITAGEGQGSIRQWPLRGGGRAGRPLRAAERRGPRAVRRTAGRRREGSLGSFRDDGHPGARDRRHGFSAGSGSGPSPAAAGRPSGAAAPDRALPVDDVEYIDPNDMEDASTDQASSAEARLLQAFPGASEVAE